MYTNDNDLYFILSILNLAAYVIAPVLLISGIAIFASWKSKKSKTKPVVITAISLAILGLVLGLFAYSGALKPRCCGEGYTLIQSVQKEKIS